MIQFEGGVDKFFSKNFDLVCKIEEFQQNFWVQIVVCVNVEVYVVELRVVRVEFLIRICYGEFNFNEFVFEFGLLEQKWFRFNGCYYFGVFIFFCCFVMVEIDYFDLVKFDKIVDIFSFNNCQDFKVEVEEL